MAWASEDKVDFFSLARGEMSSVDLVKMDDVTAIGIDSVLLQRLSCKEQRIVSVLAKKKRGRVRDFIWSLTSTDWWGCVNLVDGFQEAEPSHNYFADDEMDDTIILIQYKQSAAYRGLE